MSFTVTRTAEFNKWLDSLSDRKGRLVIIDRIGRVGAGLLGDVEPVGDGVSELKINFGPGYRVYFVKQGLTVIVLLCGGDKGSQRRDIKRAKVIAANLQDYQGRIPL